MYSDDFYANKKSFEPYAKMLGYEVDDYIELMKEMDARDDYYEENGIEPPEPFYHEDDPFGECSIEDIDPDDLGEEYWRTV